MKVPFLDLGRETAALRPELEEAIARVLSSGRYVLSEEVERFEQAFAAACSCAHAIGVASGTDALTIALLACGVEPGDEVVTAANTCVPTVVGIERAGARAVLADVDPITYTLDPADVERRLTPRTRALVPVHLYGGAADLEALQALARARGLRLVEDCAQAHGGTFAGRPLGSHGDAAAFSFYPTKNLGALGDGGAVVTSSAEVAERARLLRNYGERGRFEHVLRGLNSRLDSLQAALLDAKLPSLEAAVARRRALARVYDEALGATDLVTPAPPPDEGHAYHLYVVQSHDRERLRAALADAGLETAVHYPTPVHRQPAYRDLEAPGGFPVAEALCERVVSLPLSEHHTDEEIAFAAAAARASAVAPRR